MFCLHTHIRSMGRVATSLSGPILGVRIREALSLPALYTCIFGGLYIDYFYKNRNKKVVAILGKIKPRLLAFPLGLPGFPSLSELFSDHHTPALYAVQGTSPQFIPAVLNYFLEGIIRIRTFK